MPEMICPRSSAQNSGFHLQTRWHHASIGCPLQTDSHANTCTGPSLPSSLVALSGRGVQLPRTATYSE
jgi:hypothetical protein